jgi:hypothetical protein
MADWLELPETFIVYMVEEDGELVELVSADSYRALVEKYVELYKTWKNGLRG